VKLRVDPDKCQGHARCYGLAPEIFDVDDYGQSSVIVDEVPPELGAIGYRPIDAAKRGDMVGCGHSRT